MSAVGLQTIDDIDTLLTDNWTAANTDSVTPIITNSLQTPWEDLDYGAKDHVYIKLDIDVSRATLHAAEFFHDVAITLEIGTGGLGSIQAGRAHFKKVVDEAIRIINANARQTGYAKTVVRDFQPRYFKERNIFLANVHLDLLKVRTT